MRLRVVTANGTIADLSPGRVTLHPKWVIVIQSMSIASMSQFKNSKAQYCHRCRYEHEPVTVLTTHPNNDLFFAMRGAGASFAIATEFLYQVYPAPETQPAIFLGTVSFFILHYWCPNITQHNNPPSSQ